MLPNGRTLDYTITNPFIYPNQAGDDAGVVGVEKQSFVSGLFATGKESGYYQAPLIDQTDTSADLTTWNTRVAAGEPYDDSVAQDAITLIARFRSPYNMPAAAGGPAPLFISNGWTDDLFPPDEASAVLQPRARRVPGQPDRPAVLEPRPPARRGRARRPGHRLLARCRRSSTTSSRATARRRRGGVEAYLTSWPAASGASPGPISAGDWAGLHPGEVRSSPGRMSASRRRATRARTRSPIPWPRATTRAARCPARPTRPAARPIGFPRSPARLHAARLPDRDRQVRGPGRWRRRSSSVACGTSTHDGSEILVAKGVYRPVGSGVEVFQLHANGWHFAVRSHAAAPAAWIRTRRTCARPTARSSIAASDLHLRLPAAEGPDCSQVLSPAAPVLPEPATTLSRTLAPGVSGGDTGSCGSARQTSVGRKPGTVGGQSLTKGGTAVTPTAKAKSLKASIRFGKKRHQPPQVRAPLRARRDPALLAGMPE